MNEELVIGAELLPYCALGRLAEVVAAGLLARGVPVRVHAFKTQEDFGSKLMPVTRTLLTDEAPNMLVGPLGDFPINYGRYENTLVFTMWETNAIRKDCVGWLNRQQAVVVPTKWNQTTFRCCGVTVPIYVVPLGIDTEVFRPDETLFPKRVFLTAGRSAHGVRRKGLNFVMLAFLTAFPNEPDVVLQVKTHPDCPVLDVSCPRIQVIREHFDEATLVRWYRSGLCYVSGATGEGWGLHQHEAMACGKPLISVPYGGVAEFFHWKTHGWPVRFRTELAESNYAMGGQWAVPDLESMAKAMRAAYENPYGAFLRGLQASADVSKFTNVRMLNGLRDVVYKTILPCR